MSLGIEERKPQMPKGKKAYTGADRIDLVTDRWRRVGADRLREVNFSKAMPYRWKQQYGAM